MEIQCIVQICKETNCKLRILPGIYEIIDGKVSLNSIRDVDLSDLLGREEICLDNDEISMYLKNEVVLVTGGGGSIGSELCRQICKFNPKKLIILDNYENSAYDLHNELIALYKEADFDIEVVIASIRDLTALEYFFSAYKPTVIFHAAAHKHVPLMENSPAEAIKNNIYGTLNVVRMADQFNAKKFVLISTDKAVNPTNIMGATKRIAEMIIQSFNSRSRTEYVAVRFGNVLGSNGSVIPLFKKQIENGGPVLVTHPDITRYFMTIPEASLLVIQAGGMAVGGEIFVLDMGKPVKIVDLAKDLIKLSGFEPDIDIKIEYTGLRQGEKLYEELLLREEGISRTKHGKIFIAKPLELSYEKLIDDLDFLSSVKYDDIKVREALATITGTYTYNGKES